MFLTQRQVPSVPRASLFIHLVDWIFTFTATPTCRLSASSKPYGPPSR